jgi:RNA polymerase sigma-70 factor (ECF subfamily)
MNGSPDGQLLERYVSERDETAFAALVERFGSMVFRVCQRVLQDQHEAEDACQATFLVLLRRAGSLDGTGSLAKWLCAVAERTSRKARARVLRRRTREQDLPTGVAAPCTEEAAWGEFRRVLDEELSRLPAMYRAPLILCCLQGYSHQEAARLLGWPCGSMSRRLRRARQLLRERLTRRGIPVPTDVRRNSQARSETPRSPE